MLLIKPDLAHLTGYLDCLKRGWNPNSFQQSDGPLEQEINEIKTDPISFLKSTFDITGHGKPIPMNDGTLVERLPSFSKWLWDGEFCGRIQFRWQTKTVHLPPTCLGHIGYGVVPWQRNKAYAKLALRAMIEEIRFCGLPYVELVADVDNQFSQKVILACEGEFIEDFKKLPANGGGIAKRFRISLA